MATATLADYQAINDAIATGASKVRFADGRETTFRTLEDLRSIRDEMAAELGLTSEPLRVTYASFDRS